ncbi:unnamed protein product [Dibothriocephalus latus]|uniref:Protein kinase domain-containing protein n=1 Tax=Dibothriocephalus latus TaxID=60516 RepID=A0A3P7PC20_DIBLA|nr:unnamed protein product [Dibothriocephalus latus]
MVPRIDRNDLRCFGHSDTFQAPIGSGNSGLIYKGFYRGNLVAIKELLNKDNKLSRYRELIYLYECHCPNIIALVAAGPDPARGCLEYIVIEFAPNSSLEKLLESGVEYGMSHAFLWFLHAANALEYLHEHCKPPKIHRDLKPKNMLLFDNCRLLKLCDFGTTREEDEDLTADQGSPRYMAPEISERK